MKKQHTKVIEPSEIKKIMMLMSMEKGAMDARNLMTLANNIANTQYYQTIKEHSLYLYQTEAQQTISTWEDYCREVIKVPTKMVDDKIAQLPQLIEDYEELSSILNFPKFVTGLNKNTVALQELLK